MAQVSFAPRSIASGFDGGEFEHLSKNDRRKLLMLIARIAEQAYRRGAQHGTTLAMEAPHLLPRDFYSWRYVNDLDRSPPLDSPRFEASVERLFAQCKELTGLGFVESNDGSS